MPVRTTYHDTKPEPVHFEDRVRQCVDCTRWVLIPHNYIGGGYFLQGWVDPKGKQHFGFHCSECFDKLHKIDEVVLRRRPVEVICQK